MTTLRRRDFIKAGTAGVAVVAASRRVSGASVATNDQIGLGVIGIGRQGLYNMKKFQEFPDVRVLAVCDVYEPHLSKAKEASGTEGYRDFRKVLDRQDIDAVLISSPDHWHPLMTVMACQSGKDVYVEKPISVAVREGRKMVEAARRYGRVVQVGTMQRSGRHFQEAVKLIQRGDLGKISSVRTWNFGNASPDGIGAPADTDPPENLDWDMWLGPAPAVPFNANRFGVGPDRWSTFRMFWDYAGGMMTDWGVHLLDIVQWAMKADAPKTVSANGRKFILTDNRDTPDTLNALYEYEDFICTYENRECNSEGINGHGYGIEFYGSEGTMFLDRSGFRVGPQKRGRGDRAVSRMYSMEFDDINDSNYDHVADFLSCMRSRKEPISDIEIGHRSTTTCLLANVSIRTGHKLVWDGNSETVAGDPEAGRLLDREYREPWKLEVQA